MNSPPSFAVCWDLFNFNWQCTGEYSCKLMPGIAFRFLKTKICLSVFANSEKPWIRNVNVEFVQRTAKLRSVPESVMHVGAADLLFCSLNYSFSWLSKQTNDYLNAKWNKCCSLLRKALSCAGEKSISLSGRVFSPSSSIVVIKVFHSAKPLTHRIRIFIFIAVKCRLKGSVSRYFSKFKQNCYKTDWNNCSKLKKRRYK